MIVWMSSHGPFFFFFCRLFVSVVLIARISGRASSECLTWNNTTHAVSWVCKSRLLDIEGLNADLPDSSRPCPRCIQAILCLCFAISFVIYQVEAQHTNPICVAVSIFHHLAGIHLLMFLSFLSIIQNLLSRASTVYPPGASQVKDNSILNMNQQSKDIPKMDFLDTTNSTAIYPMMVCPMEGMPMHTQIPGETHGMMAHQPLNLCLWHALVPRTQSEHSRREQPCLLYQTTMIMLDQ